MEEEEFVSDAEPTGLADGLSTGHEGKQGIKNDTQAVKQMRQLVLNLPKYKAAKMEEFTRWEGSEAKLSFSLDMLSSRYPKATKKKSQTSSWTRKSAGRSGRGDC